MDEDESGLSPNGDQGLQGDNDGDNGGGIDYGQAENGQGEEEVGQEDDGQWEDQTGRAGQSYGQRSQTRSQVQDDQEEEGLTPAQLTSLGPVASEEEINDLAAELGFTPKQFARAASFFGRIAQHNVAAAGISNAHLQEEVMLSPGLRSRTASIQQELAGIPPQNQAEKKVVQWAILTSFVKEAKPTDDFQAIAKRIAKAAGLQVVGGGGNASQSRQDGRTAPVARQPVSPSGTVSGGGRTAPAGRRPNQAPANDALSFLARRTGMGKTDLEVAAEEVAQGFRRG